VQIDVGKSECKGFYDTVQDSSIRCDTEVWQGS